MLNLTADPITLIAASGESTTHEPSGYVARVEYERRNVDTIRHTICDPRDEACRKYIPIYEEIPKEIVFSCAQDKDGILSSDFIAEVASKNKGLYLVTREVAEAAAVGFMQKCCPTCSGDDMCMYPKPHALADRMVWAAEPVTEDRYVATHTAQDGSQWDEREVVTIGYRELHCVPGAGR